MKKRMLLLAVLALLFLALPLISFAETVASGTRGNTHWELSDDGMLIISGNGKMYEFGYKYSSSDRMYITEAPWGITPTSVIIEEGVTSICRHAFQGNRNLISVVIPESVASIGEEAFHNCSSLSSVTIPNGVTIIERSAFSNCSNLSNVKLSASLMSINTSTFFDCYSLNNVIIPNGVTSIGDYAFSCCSSLNNIALPDSIVTIGTQAFYQCNSLTRFTIPCNVESIGENAFGQCENLTAISIPRGVTNMGSRIFSECSNLTNVTLSEGITSIGNAMFENCSRITNIVLPSSITNIGDYAFWGTSLTSITIPEEVISVGGRAFGYCSTLTNVDFLITDEEKAINFGENTFFSPYPTIYCHIYTAPDVYFSSLGGYNIVYLEDIGIDDIRTVALPEDFRMACGDTRTLACEVFPLDGAPMTWSSSDPTVLAVENGTVTALSTGTATVTATVGAVSDSLSIEIYAPATGIVLNASDVWLQAKDSVVLFVASYEPENASAEIAWSSSDASLAIVNGNGEVTTYKPGEVTITATTEKDISASCILHLTRVVTSVTLEPASATMYPEDTVQLTATAVTSGGNYTNQLVSFSSDDETIATVDDSGVVTAVRPGTATITASTTNKKYATVDIIVLCSGHIPVTDEAISPTCTETGLTEGSHCSLCGEVLVPQEIIEALEHMVVIDVAVEPTCTESGLTEGSHCELCGEVLIPQEIVPALGHDDPMAHTDAAAATCTTEGNTEYWHCSKCGKYFSDAAAEHEIVLADTVIAELGHDDPMAHTDAAAATCTTEGNTEYWHCTKCGKYFSDAAAEHEIALADTVIAATGHDDPMVHTAAVAATCTTAGNTEYWHCTKCGKYFSDAAAEHEIALADTVIAALGHDDPMAHTEAAAATCTTEGNTEYWHCTKCGKYFSDAAAEHEIALADTVIAAVDHNWNAAEYEWAADHLTITATHTCKNDASHTETETVSVVYVIASPTDDTMGSVTYTSAEYSKEGFTRQTKSVEIPALNNLSVIRLPNMLAAIEDEAFENLACEAIIIPNGCTSIGHYAFRNCKNLRYIKVPANLEIPVDAFEGCGNVVIDRVTE